VRTDDARQRALAALVRLRVKMLEPRLGRGEIGDGAQVAPRQPRPGEEVWRLGHDGHEQMCELHDGSKAGAGWDVLLLEDGELLMSRRCVVLCVELKQLQRDISNP
jgi:hypothetical protein